jgi:hypothetical protein
VGGEVGPPVSLPPRALCRIGAAYPCQVPQASPFRCTHISKYLGTWAPMYLDLPCKNFLLFLGVRPPLLP